MAIASAKINARIMEIKILGAAEGFRPKALTAANPTVAITADGPAVAISIIRTAVNVPMII